MRFSYLLFVALSTLGSSLEAVNFQQVIPDIVLKDDDIKISLPDQHVSPQGSENSKVFYGPTSLNNTNHQDLEIYGPADFKTVNVKEKLEVTGPLTGKGVKAHHLKVTGPLSLKASEIGDGIVHGPVELNTTTVKGAFVVYGPLVAEGSQFQNTLTVHTNEMQLINSHVRGVTIVFQEGQAGAFGLNIGDNVSVVVNGKTYNLGNLKEKEPILYLDNRSTITGDVVFQGRRGLVVLGYGAIFKGNVINGSVSRATR